jgi:hypothetical protein
MHVLLCQSALKTAPLSASKIGSDAYLVIGAGAGGADEKGFEEIELGASVHLALALLVPFRVEWARQREPFSTD